MRILYNCYREFLRKGPIFLRGKFFQSGVVRSTNLLRSLAGGVGGGAFLSISFFGSGGKKSGVQDVPDIDMIIREADLLYESYLVDNAYNLLRRYRSSEDPELLWRIARVLCEQGKQSKNPEEKKRLIHEALEFAERALKNEPASGSFGAHKWYGIVLQYVADMQGTRAKIEKANEYRAHWERALEINPLDATTWHLLGIWHYEIAAVPSYQRWGASILYASLPQTTFEEALRHFERAETICPNFYSANNYYLGLVYERMNRKEEALAQFKKAFYAPVVSVQDKETHQNALERLRNNYKYDEQRLIQEQKSV